MKTYQITRDELNLILHHAGELYEVGTHMTFKYLKDHEGKMDEELLCDGGHYRCDKHYQEIYRMVNRLCPDEKLDGEIE